ncbi:MAG: cytochrome c3 family protein [Nitrospirota bacterium]
MAVATYADAGTIIGSKHDFSDANAATTPFAGVWEVPGAGGFPLVIDEVCVFCHTPHGSSMSVPGMTNPPLWNRTNSPSPVVPTAYSYSMYSSATMSATVSSSPTGISMMCMSCHDGVTSIAVGVMMNAPGSGNPAVTPNGISGNGAMGDVYNGSAFLGWGPNLGEAVPGTPSTINLSNDHPISFDWPTKPGIRTAPTNSSLRRFGAGNRVECATCHVVHDPTNVPFLAMSNAGSAMCIACHDK